MTRSPWAPLKQLLSCCVALGCAACVGTGPRSAASPPDAVRSAEAMDTQVLVMLKDEEALPHYRPDQAYAAGYMQQPGSMATARTLAAVNRDYGLTRLDEWPMPALGLRCYLEAAGTRQERDRLLSRLAADARVESAEPVQRYRVLGHGDPYFDLQAGSKLMQLDALHRMATGRRVRVAQIDSGVELTHPDLAGQVVDAPDLVDSRPEHAYEAHGTEVAGIIAARADNGVGIVGVAPAAELLALRACWQEGPQGDAAACSSFTLAKALQYALSHRVQVLNMSLAGPPDRLLERLLRRAHEQGINIVAAADPLAAPGPGFPAELPFVIAVASQRDTPDTPGMRSAPHVLYAPGEHVLTTTPHGSWGFVSGNSFAAAQVSGLVALILEASPALTADDVSRLLQDHARAALAAGRGSIIDACVLLAVQAKRAGCACCAAHPLAASNKRP